MIDTQLIYVHRFGPRRPPLSVIQFTTTAARTKERMNRLRKKQKS